MSASRVDQERLDPAPARGRRTLVLTLVAWLLLSGCELSDAPKPGPDEHQRPPNVLLISIDTLRADHLGSYGYHRDTSPFLDSLARSGVRFDNAFAPSSWTLPSHASLFTGCYPQTHGVEQHRYSLPLELDTVTESFRLAGYQTAGFITWTYLKADFGFGRGFEHFAELLPALDDQDSAAHRSTRAVEVVAAVSSWIELRQAEESDRPFFLFLHLFDPHMSYEPPVDIAQRFDPNLSDIEGGSYELLSRYVPGLHPNAPLPPVEVVGRATLLYDAEIRYTDQQIERLFVQLRNAGMLDHTVIAIVSDHGEELGEHGSMEGHQWTLYDEVIRIPLILVLPDGRARGVVEKRLVELVDVAPTLLDYARLEPLPHADGSSLLSLLGSEEAGPEGTAGSEETEWEELAFSHIRRFNKKVAVRTPTHKLIYTEDTGTNLFGHPIRPGFELYDLAVDPGEQTNVFDPDNPTARRLVRRLQDLLALPKPFEAGAAPALTQEERDRLESLGYVR